MQIAKTQPTTLYDQTDFLYAKIFAGTRFVDEFVCGTNAGFTEKTKLVTKGVNSFLVVMYSL